MALPSGQPHLLYHSSPADYERIVNGQCAGSEWSMRWHINYLNRPTWQTHKYQFRPTSPGNKTVLIVDM
jgi:hypothetical protein